MQGAALGKGRPLPSDATQQTRFPAATLWDGPAKVNTAEAHPFVASRMQWPALWRVSLRGLHLKSPPSLTRGGLTSPTETVGYWGPRRRLEFL